MFCALHDQLASLGSHAHLTHCFSAVAELLVYTGRLFCNESTDVIVTLFTLILIVVKYGGNRFRGGMHLIASVILTLFSLVVFL